MNTSTWISSSLGVVIVAAGGAVAQTTERVSVDSAGNQGNGGSATLSSSTNSPNPSVSEDGRLVAFLSAASNLVPGDTNGTADIFVHDRVTGATERVNVDSSGNEANGSTANASFSADGRHVAFESVADNLVPGDTNGLNDIFVHDRVTGTTERVSVSATGAEGNSLSFKTSISADGRYVAFTSAASNLVPGDTNNAQDIFVHDRQTGALEIVSVDSSGNQANGASNLPSLSDSGRHVAFQSFADNLVPGDTNLFSDVFVHDRQTGTTERISVDSSGNQGNGNSDGPYISGQGRHVAFYSLASNLVPGDSNGVSDIFVHDRQTGATERVSLDSSGNQAEASSGAGSISADGRYVAFQSDAGNLVAGDTNGVTDVFLRDRQTGATVRVGVGSTGTEGNGASSNPSVSLDGRYVAFQSLADNLVPNDTNGTFDAFLRDRGAGSGSLTYCTAGTSASGCTAAISSTGAASATAPSGFTVAVSGIEGLQDGLFFYAQNGRQANPWGNGTSYQCVVPPIRRGGLLVGSGNAGACNGAFAQDLNARWCPSCPKPIHAPVPGTKLQVQFWYRDPTSTSNQTTSFSNAVEEDVVP